MAEYFNHDGHEESPDPKLDQRFFRHFHHLSHRWPALTFYGNLPAKYSENTVSWIEWMHWFEGVLKQVADGELALDAAMTEITDALQVFEKELPDIIKDAVGTTTIASDDPAKAEITETYPVLLDYPEIAKFVTSKNWKVEYISMLAESMEWLGMGHNEMLTAANYINFNINPTIKGDDSQILQYAPARVSFAHLRVDDDRWVLSNFDMGAGATAYGSQAIGWNNTTKQSTVTGRDSFTDRKPVTFDLPDRHVVRVWPWVNHNRNDATKGYKDGFAYIIKDATTGKNEVKSFNIWQTQAGSSTDSVVLSTEKEPLFIGWVTNALDDQSSIFTYVATDYTYNLVDRGNETKLVSLPQNVIDSIAGLNPEKVFANAYQLVSLVPANQGDNTTASERIISWNFLLEKFEDSGNFKKPFTPMNFADSIKMAGNELPVLDNTKIAQSEGNLFFSLTPNTAELSEVSEFIDYSDWETNITNKEFFTTLQSQYGGGSYANTNFNLYNEILYNSDTSLGLLPVVELVTPDEIDSVDYFTQANLTTAVANTMQEVKRAEAAEGDLSDNINNLKNYVDAADNNLQVEINNEIKRAEDAEAGLSDRIDAISGRNLKQVGLANVTFFNGLVNNVGNHFRAYGISVPASGSTPAYKTLQLDFSLGSPTIVTTPRPGSDGWYWLADLSLNHSGDPAPEGSQLAFFTVTDPDFNGLTNAIINDNAHIANSVRLAIAPYTYNGLQGYMLNLVSSMDGFNSQHPTMALEMPAGNFYLVSDYPQITN